MFPEMQQLEKIIAEMGPLVRTERLAESEKNGVKMPIYMLSFGSEDPKAPVLGLVGGVHGLERIGSQVCLSLLHSFTELLLWDQHLQSVMKNLRIFFIPILNPQGVYHKTRCNPNGVDLMRNAPVEADDPLRWVGGHRVSPHLPWYRGQPGALEVEAQALIDGVKKEIFSSSLAITVDFHSGFGWQDQIWFPYAKTVTPFPDLAAGHAFKELLDRTYPHHFYRIEPQAKNYTTHGDLWDFLYDQYREQNPGVYLPLCLEMGSWMWVKKNPLQLFSALGPYNPMKEHRHKRTLRRHNTFFEFLVRATSSPKAWALLSPEQKQKHELRAKELWYE